MFSFGEMGYDWVPMPESPILLILAYILCCLRAQCCDQYRIYSHISLYFLPGNMTQKTVCFFRA